MVCMCVCVCLCVCGLHPALWGQNVYMAISKIAVLVGTFFGPHEEISL